MSDVTCVQVLAESRKGIRFPRDGVQAVVSHLMASGNLAVLGKSSKCP